MLNVGGKKNATKISSEKFKFAHGGFMKILEQCLQWLMLYTRFLNNIFINAIFRRNNGNIIDLSLKSFGEKRILGYPSTYYIFFLIKHTSYLKMTALKCLPCIAGWQSQRLSWLMKHVSKQQLNDGKNDHRYKYYMGIKTSVFPLWRAVGCFVKLTACQFSKFKENPVHFRLNSCMLLI